MLEFIDGFDHYDNGGNIGVFPWQQKWDSTSGFSIHAGDTGTVHFPALPGCLSCSIGLGTIGGAFLSLSPTGRNILAPVATRIVGAAIYWTGLEAGVQGIPIFTDGPSPQLKMLIDAGGHITAVRPGTPDVLLGTSTHFFTTGRWYYVEVKATISSAGSVLVKVTSGGARSTWLSLSGVNTQATANASTDGILWQAGAFGRYQLDDFYCLNTTGGTYTDFLGEQRIVTSLPSADGAATAWTPNSGGNRYSRVNEATPDGDTSYAYSNTPGQIALFDFVAIAPGGTLTAVQVGAFHRKDDTGDREWCIEYRDAAAVNHDGASIDSPTNYVWDDQVYEADPATSAAWVTADLNASQFGMQVVS